jgi:hypothetical protein
MVKTIDSLTDVKNKLIGSFKEVTDYFKQHISDYLEVRNAKSILDNSGDYSINEVDTAHRIIQRYQKGYSLDGLKIRKKI